MATKQPPQLEEAVEEEELDLDALLESPEEKGYYDCAVPEEVAADDEAAAEVRPVQPIKARCLREFTALEHDELVIRRGGSYEVADPFLAAWLRMPP